MAGAAQRAQDRAGIGVPVSGPAISTRGVTRDFKAGQQTITVLHGIDLDVKAGELTFLVGESGSGKTTLISIMCGILWPTLGEVEVFGTDIYDLSDDDLVEFRLQNIGFIFQQYNLIPSIDAASNAAVPLIAQGMDRHEARKRAVAMLEKLNIGDQAGKLPNQLSGGQQQRVAIARALVHEPRLVVCDEPTAALDAASGRRVMDLLREVAVAEDRACIIVTHDNRIFDMADRILVLEDGKVTHDGKHMPEDH
nr:ABC transporter ATP-binding protein [Qipengyuania polymorpha]